MKHTVFSRILSLVLSLCIAAALCGSAFASSEELETETQRWSTEDASPASSYQAPKGAKLAFVLAAYIAEGTASVDIFIGGVLYKNVTVMNYGELLAIKDASGLNGKKSVVLTGVIEYNDFDGETVKLYDVIGPNDNIVYIPDEATAALVEETVKGLFSFGTSYGVDALYTFDHGYGLYVDGYIADVSDDCAYYAVSDDGLSVLDSPANALLPSSALASVLEAPYSLAATERDENGRITAIYYTNTFVSPNSLSVKLGLVGNAAVNDETVDEYAKYLDYDYNGFTATSDTTETATYLYTGAAVGTDGTLAFADGALNTYEPVVVEDIALTEDGIVRYDDGSVEYANGKALAYATNGGRLTVNHAVLENGYSVANGGILGALEAGSIFWGLSQESGYNAVLFATNGGELIFGDPDGERSYVRSYGHIGNGVFATGTGLYDMESEDTSAGTAEAYVYNTDLWVDGWNGHVTDATRGGFIYLENVEGYSGYPGSMLGNGSGLTTDTGDGMVIAVDSHIEVFGMGSGGMYIIGTNSTGIAINSTLRSWVDSGAVSASGGHIIGINSSFTGRAGFRNRGGSTGVSTFENCAINCSNAYSGTVTLFEGRPYEQTIDFSYNVNFSEEDAAKYITNDVDGERLSIFELSLPDSIFRNTAGNTADTAKYDNLYCGAGANGYNGIWAENDAFASPYCWSTGESASYVTCFEFESSSITLDLTNCTYAVENTYNDSDSDAVMKDFDFLAVSEFGSNPTLNFIDHDETITGILYNEGYSETHLNMGMPTKDDSAMTVNFLNSDFIGTLADGDLGLWETDVTYQNVNGEETNLNGNYFCAVPNGGGNYTFDADSTWYVWSDSYAGTLTLADESCVESYDGTPKTVYLCYGLNIGDTSYTEGESVTVGDVTFVVDSSVFGQEPAPWEGEYTITANVVSDDPAAAAATVVTVPETAAYGDTFDITIELPEGYGVAYVTACGQILGTDENVQCTASFSVELEGALDIEVAIAPVEGSNVWQYEDNGDGTVTITGTTKYSQDTENRYCIVPGELDGKPVTGFGLGTDNVLYRSELYSITFSEGIERFAYQALYDLNGCQIGILPASAAEIDEGFVRSMPAVSWGIHAASDAAQEYVAANQYSYEYINTWEQTNIDAMNENTGSGSSEIGSGEPS
ncbi:MAG: hypothetical protein ACI3W7_06685 [Oscillospiraceae bacterium]